MRRTFCILYNSFERGWRDKTVFPNDQRGRFSLEEAAAELELDEEYVASLYKPLHYTYRVRGEFYPAVYGRASRPGTISASRAHMFPLYRRSSRLDKELRQLDVQRYTRQ